MSNHVFISHTNHADDNTLTILAAETVKSVNLIPYVAENDCKAGTNLWGRITNKIRSSTWFIAVLTCHAATSHVVSAEIATARAYGKPVVLLREDGARLPLSEEGNEYIPLDRRRPETAFAKLKSRMSTFRKRTLNGDTDYLIVIGFILVVFALILFLIDDAEAAAPQYVQRSKP